MMTFFPSPKTSTLFAPYRLHSLVTQIVSMAQANSIVLLEHIASKFLQLLTAPHPESHLS